MEVKVSVVVGVI